MLVKISESGRAAGVFSWMTDMQLHKLLARTYGWRALVRLCLDTILERATGVHEHRQDLVIVFTASSGLQRHQGHMQPLLGTAHATAGNITRAAIVVENGTCTGSCLLQALLPVLPAVLEIYPAIQDQLGSSIFRQVELFPELIWQLQTMILPGCKHLLQVATPLRGD